MKSGVGLPLAGLEDYASRTQKEQISGLETLAPTWVGGLATKSLSCPAVGIFGIVAQISKIPFELGQGYWLIKEIGGKASPTSARSYSSKGAAGFCWTTIKP